MDGLRPQHARNGLRSAAADPVAERQLARQSRLPESAVPTISWSSRSAAEEVTARLRAVIRRFAGHATDRLTAGDVELDLKARSAWIGGEPLDLTRNEFRLLRLFVMRSERFLSGEELLGQLYARKQDRSTNSVEVADRPAAPQDRQGTGSRPCAGWAIGWSPNALPLASCEKCESGTTRYHARRNIDQLVAGNLNADILFSPRISRLLDLCIVSQILPASFALRAG